MGIYTIILKEWENLRKSDMKINVVIEIYVYSFMFMFIVDHVFKLFLIDAKKNYRAWKFVCVEAWGSFYYNKY